MEDDEALRRLMRQALALAGYHVTEARAGFEALQQLDRQLPDIIVLDLLMPGIDGFTVRTELAAQAQTRHIPIVVITAITEDLRWLDVKCLLRKPVTPEELVHAVNTATNRSQRPARLSALILDCPDDRARIAEPSSPTKNLGRRASLNRSRSRPRTLAHGIHPLRPKIFSSSGIFVLTVL